MKTSNFDITSHAGGSSGIQYYSLQMESADTRTTTASHYCREQDIFSTTINRVHYSYKLSMPLQGEHLKNVYTSEKGWATNLHHMKKAYPLSLFIMY